MADYGRESVPAWAQVVRSITTVRQRAIDHLMKAVEPWYSSSDPSSEAGVLRIQD